MTIILRLSHCQKGDEVIHPTSFRKSEYLKLGCLSGVFAMVFHSLYDFNLHIPANGLYFTVLLALVAGTLTEEYDHKFFRKAVDSIIMLGFFIALFAIIQKFSYNGHIYWVGMRANHPVGPFYNYDHYAGFMAMCSSLAVSMVAASMMHTSFFRQQGFVKKVLWFSTVEANRSLRYIMMSAVMVATIFISTSRGGIMSFALSQIIFFAIVLWAGWRARKSGRIVGILTTIVLLIGVMVVWLGPEAFLKRFHLFSIQKIIKMEGPIDVRLLFYNDTLKMIKDFKVIGTGLNTFGTSFTKYRTFDYTDDYLRYTHNDYLQLISETGLAGALFLAGFMYLFLASMIRVARKLE